MEDRIYHVIAHIENNYIEKFGIPRQPGLADKVISKIVFEDDFRDINTVRGLEEFSHLWIIWEFSKATDKKWQATVRPPRLGGNKRLGVFATRSPYRPNPIAISVVKIVKIDTSGKNSPVIYVSGADLLNDTPVLDLKPYIPYSDSIVDAKGGFAQEKPLNYNIVYLTNVDKIPPEEREELEQILSLNPQPSYQHDPERIYGMRYGKRNIKFKVNQQTIVITDIENIEDKK